MMIPPIQPNDTIALICPGSRCHDKNQVEKTADYLNQKYHLQTIYQKETYKPSQSKERAEILLEYLFNPTVKALWALRGGEGTADLIPLIHQKKHLIKKLNPKLLLGCSDVTALLLYFSQQYHWPAIHAFNARQLALNTIGTLSEKMTLDLLFNSHLSFSIPIKPLNPTAQKKRSITGLATGGNLSLINISVRDVWEIQTKNKILFLEDINEKPHAILRMLKYLNRINFLKNIRALILGKFMFSTHQDEKLQPLMQRSLKIWAQTIHKPIFYTDYISHGELNLPIPFYMPIHLKLLKGHQIILKVNE